ncbi:hypothetical protein JXA32_10795 [Candidatus Sumerlaeota bacterium]|nr:hypothetical protein [Candidatus Sumerlaeota bacterium]
METIEPRIYRLKLRFDESKPWSMKQLCSDLAITAEQQEPIHEDKWGLRGLLELWFQEINKNEIILHIQKKHSSYKRKYLEDLRKFFSDLDQVAYIQGYEEII